MAEHPGYTYNWEGPNAFSSTEEDPSIANVTLAAGGTYTVTITDANGCTGTDATTVVVNANPVCTINGPSAVCANTTGHVYSGPAGMSTYSWSISGNGSIPGATTGQNVTVDAGTAGSYTLTLTIVGWQWLYEHLYGDGDGERQSGVYDQWTECGM